jgi:transmembrane 9 superfamily protein 2/4
MSKAPSPAWRAVVFFPITCFCVLSAIACNLSTTTLFIACALSRLSPQVYFQLCSEDHRWWWRSILASGSAGIYLFLYSVYYFLTKLHMADRTSVLLYFGYMSIVSLLFFLMTGTMGHLATFAFVRKIYGSIKVD